MKTKVNSVLGPIEVANLGFTLMHEHVLLSPPGVFRDCPELFGTMLKKRLKDNLKKAKEGGIDTIVDATTPDLGRDINLLVEASRQSGINIIACSGWWLDFPRFFEGVSIRQLADIFTREIEVGISGTNIKAGLLKAASDRTGVTMQEEIILRAVARAHHNTGAPIMLHSYSPGRVGERQLSILKEEGVDLRRVKMDHSNDTMDLEYLKWIFEQGCFIGLDHPGYLGEDPNHLGHKVKSIDRIKILKELIDLGYSERLCPSHDWTILRIIADNSEISAEDRQIFNPDVYLHLKKIVFPKLLEMGVSKIKIDSLCINAPRNYFSAG